MHNIFLAIPKGSLNALKAITRNEGLVQTVNIYPETHKAAITSLTMWLFGKFPLKLNGSHIHNVLRPNNLRLADAVCAAYLFLHFFFIYFFFYNGCYPTGLYKGEIRASPQACVAVGLVAPNHTPNTKQDTLTSCLRGQCYWGCMNIYMLTVHKRMSVSSTEEPESKQTLVVSLISLTKQGYRFIITGKKH